MPRVEVLKPFRFAEGGLHIISIGVGVQEISREAAVVAIAEGWAREVEFGARESITIDQHPREHKARVRAPRTKA